MRKAPEKLYIVRQENGSVSRAYKHLHQAKKLMRGNSELITYSVESSSNLTEIKREKRLAVLLDDGNSDGFPNKVDNSVVKLLQKYVSFPHEYLTKRFDNELNRITERSELKRLLMKHKTKLLINIDSVEEFEDLLSFHNFRYNQYSKARQDLFLEAKENIKKRNKQNKPHKS